MNRLLLVLVGLLTTSAPCVTGEGASTKAAWQTYIDDTYKLTLQFPGEWKSHPESGDRVRFEMPRPPRGISRGYFQLDAMSDGSSSLQQHCKGLAEHHLQPFGAHPTVRTMKVDGQDACLVWPSEDQVAPWDAAVLVEYPAPVLLDGDRWPVLMLDADKDYILGIARSIRFMRSSSTNAPFVLEIAKDNAMAWKTDGSLSLVVTIKNTSHTEVHLKPGEPASDYRTILKRAKSGDLVEASLNLPSTTAATRSLNTRISPQGTYRNTIEVSFRNGETAGEYSLQLERALPPELGKGIVVSNTIKLTASD
jgi:hypothetical protein